MDEAVPRVAESSAAERPESLSAPERAADEDSGPRSPWGPLFAGWLVPGAGHLLLGRPWPALFVAAAVLPLFVGGMALAGWENVSQPRHPWLFVLQVLAGLPTAAAAWATRGLELTEFHRFHTVGDTFTCVAGLLNFVALGDVWERASSGDPEARLARKLAAEAEADTGPATVAEDRPGV